MKCDYCVATGLVEVQHVKHMTTLMFCGHHADKFIVALLDKGFTVIKDER